MTALVASDSPAMSGHLLSGIAAVERLRVSLDVPQHRLADAAGISDRTYRRYVAGRAKASPAMVARLNRALDRVGLVEPKLDERTRALMLATWRAFVGELLPIGAGVGVTLDDVVASDPRRGATADPKWRACRRIAQAGIYLLATAFDDISQRRLAELFDLTPAAICLALRAVEDARDDPAFEAAIEAAQRKMTGRAAA